MQEPRFKSYTPEFQAIAATSPMLVSTTKNPEDETKEQFIATHDRFLALPEFIKDKLASIRTSEKIRWIGKNFNLSDIQMSDIARAIRKHYFGELKTEEFPSYLAKEFPIDPSKAKEISAFILKDIVNDATEEQKYKQKIISTPIAQVLKEIPEIGEQLVTSDRIKVLNFPEPARPSVKNWLADYTSIFGHGRHDAIQVANYLFHSANTQTLSPADRHKLSYILKSFNENTPIEIDSSSKQIIFPAFAAPTPKRMPAAQIPKSKFGISLGLSPKNPREKTYSAQKNTQTDLTKKPDQRIDPPVRQKESSAQPNMNADISRRPVQETKAPVPPQASPKKNIQPMAPPQISRRPVEAPIEKKTFPKTEVPTKTAPGTPPADLPTGKVSFSSPHKLPSEKAKAQPFRITPFSERDDEDPNDNLPKNVVNLKDS